MQVLKELISEQNFKATVNGENLGIYFLEEHSKQLMKTTKKRGPIIGWIKSMDNGS